MIFCRTWRKADSCEEAAPSQGFKGVATDALKTFEIFPTDKTTPVEDKAWVAMRLSRT